MAIVLASLAAGLVRAGEAAGEAAEGGGPSPYAIGALALGLLLALLLAVVSFGGGREHS